MKYEDKYEELKKWDDTLMDMILEEGSFNNKVFTMPLTTKISKADREEISDMVLQNNSNILLEIQSNSKEINFICKDFSINEIINLIKTKPCFNEKLLPSDYITDENQSVVWNREQVVIYNEKIKELKMRDSKYNQILDSMLIDAVIEDTTYSNSIFDGIPKEAFKRIWSKAWEDGHAYGYHEVISYFNDEMDLFEDILKIMKEKKD